MGTPRRSALVLTLLIALGAATLAFSLMMALGALRAHALAARPPLASFRAAPGKPGEQEDLELAFLGDLQGGVVSMPRGVAEALKRRPAHLLVSSGDLVSHGEAPFYGLVASAFKRAGITTPIRVVPGNHDLFPSRCHDDRIGGPLFERAFGPRTWALDLERILLIGIDTGTSWILPDQLPQIEQTLAQHPGKPWILISHRAPWNFARAPHVSYRDTVELHPFLVKHRPALVVSGHLHTPHDTTVDGVRYIVNALGGDASGLALLRNPGQLLRVRVPPRPAPDAKGGAVFDIAFESIPRQLSLRSVIERVDVRMWEIRRRPPVAMIAALVRPLFRLVGLDVPVVRHPIQRMDPPREALLRRRAQDALGVD